MQSVPIATNVLSSNPNKRDVLCTTLCDKVCQWLAAGRWFPPDTPVSSINKTDRHDITAILLKVALNPNTLFEFVLFCFVLAVSFVSFLSNWIFFLFISIQIDDFCFVLYIWIELSVYCSHGFIINH